VGDTGRELWQSDWKRDCNQLESFRCAQGMSQYSYFITPVSTHVNGHLRFVYVLFFTLIVYYLYRRPICGILVFSSMQRGVIPGHCYDLFTTLHYTGVCCFVMFSFLCVWRSVGYIRYRPFQSSVRERERNELGVDKGSRDGCA